MGTVCGADGGGVRAGWVTGDSAGRMSSLARQEVRDPVLVSVREQSGVAIDLQSKRSDRILEFGRRMQPPMQTGCEGYDVVAGEHLMEIYAIPAHEPVRVGAVDDFGTSRA